jgi:bacterial/archaeal transporter family protein
MNKLDFGVWKTIIMSTNLWLMPTLAALLFWGVSGFAPKVAVSKMPPMEALVYQGLGVIVFVACLIVKNGLPQFDMQGALLGILTGVLVMTGQIFYIRALTQGPVSMISVLCALYPAPVILMAFVFLHEKISLMQAGGCVLALGAMAVLVSGGAKNQRGDKGWLLPGITAMLLWALWSFTPKIALQSLPPQDVLVYTGIGDLIVVSIVLAWMKEKVSFHKAGVFYAAIPSFFSTLATLAYFYAIDKGPVSVISVTTSLYPLVVILLARIFLHEKLAPEQIFAIATGLAAIILMVF